MPEHVRADKNSTEEETKQKPSNKKFEYDRILQIQLMQQPADVQSWSRSFGDVDHHTGKSSKNELNFKDDF